MLLFAKKTLTSFSWCGLAYRHFEELVVLGLMIGPLAIRVFSSHNITRQFLLFEKNEKATNSPQKISGYS